MSSQAFSIGLDNLSVGLSCPTQEKTCIEPKISLKDIQIPEKTIGVSS